jgi:hypothetical protein
MVAKIIYKFICKEVINILTKIQQEAFNEFFESIEKGENLLLSSEPRRIGKTTILNELALTLQALGYIVYVSTPYQKQEYFAHRFLSNDMIHNRGLFGDNIVVIADESKYEYMNELLFNCKVKNIPVVGYVNFKIYKPIDNVESFKREYECQWVGGIDLANGSDKTIRGLRRNAKIIEESQNNDK